MADADADRGFAPVVGKGLEAVIVVLYVTGLVATLYGGVLPTYRTAAANEVGDRVLASAADGVESSVPPAATRVSVRRRVDLPDTIRGAAYRIRADNGTLVLDHPNSAVDGRVRLSLPERVVSVRGVWESDDATVVRVDGDADELRVVLA